MRTGFAIISGCQLRVSENGEYLLLEAVSCPGQPSPGFSRRPFYLERTLHREIPEISGGVPVSTV